MVRRASISICIVAIAICKIGAQEIKRPIAEVRFHDGSVVHMTMLQSNVEIKTKYGKLEIPIEDIRKIEFGLHIPQDIDQQIANSVKKLASEVYKERNIASKDLIRIGHFAIPQLYKATKNGDSETICRATNLIKQISESTRPDLLKLRDDDIIHTAEFPIIGKISPATIKAHSPHFGEVIIKMSELRTVSIRHRSVNIEIVLDAAINGSALDQWYKSDIMINSGQRLTVSANGQVDLWPQGPGQYVAAPKGYNTAGKGGQFMAGALIAKIGENGKAFYVGERHDNHVAEDGQIYFMIVPSPWNNASSGSYKLTVRTDNK